MTATMVAALQIARVVPLHVTMTMTTRWTGLSSRSRIWARFCQSADGRLGCLGRQVAFAVRCTTFSYSRAFLPFYSTRLACTLPHAGVPPDSWTEPLILCSILLYAVVLTIQASRTLVLSGPGATPPHVKGFFHSWEDYIIFALFVFFRNVSFFRPHFVY